MKTDFNREKYNKEIIADLKKRLEENADMFTEWTTPGKRYVLMTNVMLIEDDFTLRGGRITHYYPMAIGSDSVDYLKKAWDCICQFGKFDTTTQHFIADMKEKKIIEFLSVCI